MATLEQITDRIRTAVGDDSGLGATVTFDLKGEGYIHLEDLAMGRLDPTMAFMTGRLKVSDMGVAMKLVPLLSKAKG